MSTAQSDSGQLQMSGVAADLYSTSGRGATLSEDRVYRYALWRTWDASLPPVLFVGLNPSTADEAEDDPTIRRCVGFAKGWGYGGLVMCNLFAFRATDPRELKRVADPVGEDNDLWLETYASECAITIAAWGSNPLAPARAEAVYGVLGALHVLKFTRSGQPYHPLYLPADLRPVAWAPREP